MLRDLMNRLKTVLLVTRSGRELCLAHRIVLLEGGKLIANLEPAEFLRCSSRNCGVQTPFIVENISPRSRPVMSGGFFSQYGSGIATLTLYGASVAHRRGNVATAVAVYLPGSADPRAALGSACDHGG